MTAARNAALLRQAAGILSGVWDESTAPWVAHGSGRDLDLWCGDDRTWDKLTEYAKDGDEEFWPYVEGQPNRPFAGDPERPQDAELIGLLSLLGPMLPDLLIDAARGWEEGVDRPATLTESRLLSFAKQVVMAYGRNR